LGTCGTCAVEVLRGRVTPVERTARERLRLEAVPPHSFREENGRRLRLACQCAADSDEVTLAKYSGFWGQDLSAESAEPADDFETYFGNLEYPFENLGRPRRESPSSSNGMSNGSSSRGGRGDGRTDEI
jgi:hypothetical protein